MERDILGKLHEFLAPGSDLLIPAIGFISSFRRYTSHYADFTDVLVQLCSMVYDNLESEICFAALRTLSSFVCHSAAVFDLLMTKGGFGDFLSCLDLTLPGTFVAAMRFVAAAVASSDRELWTAQGLVIEQRRVLLEFMVAPMGTADEEMIRVAGGVLASLIWNEESVGIALEVGLVEKALGLIQDGLGFATQMALLQALCRLVTFATREGVEAIMAQGFIALLAARFEGMHDLEPEIIEAVMAILRFRVNEWTDAILESAGLLSGLLDLPLIPDEFSQFVTEIHK
jgi:hypothetical protein